MVVLIKVGVQCDKEWEQIGLRDEPRLISILKLASKKVTHIWAPVAFSAHCLPTPDGLPSVLSGASEQNNRRSKVRE